MAHLLPVQRADQVVIILARHLFRIGAGMGQETFAVAGVDDAVRKARLGRVAGGEGLCQRDRLLRQVPEAAGVVLAHHRLKIVLFQPLPGADLSAVPPRGAPADAVGVKKHHVEAAFGQVQRGRKAGKARAHDADIAGQRALRRREGAGRRGRCGIPRPGKLPGRVIGVQDVDHCPFRRP